MLFYYDLYVLKPHKILKFFIFYLQIDGVDLPWKCKQNIKKNLKLSLCYFIMIYVKSHLLKIYKNKITPPKRCKITPPKITPPKNL